MMYEIANFRKGKTTRKGKPLSVRPQRVTVIPVADALEFFNCRDEQELQRHLKGCRDLGLMLTSPDRLTMRMRTGETDAKGYAVKERCYVFTCPPEEIPKRKCRRQRILRW